MHLFCNILQSRQLAVIANLAASCHGSSLETSRHFLRQLVQLSDSRRAQVVVQLSLLGDYVWLSATFLDNTYTQYVYIFIVRICRYGRMYSDICSWLHFDLTSAELAATEQIKANHGHAILA